MSLRVIFYLGSIISISIVVILGQISSWFYTMYIVLLPFIGLGIYDQLQNKKAILKNFPVLGHFRYLFLLIRPEIRQYFVESNEDGRPFSWEKRNVMSQRSLKSLDTMPFGTRVDTDRIGYEWINHSLNPGHMTDKEMHVTVGKENCSKPYGASLINISAMSYGALSKNAILALNGGAKLGRFAHNTGEGGISPHHLKNGGDLIWQVGTAYFGTRNEDGSFSPEKFKEKAKTPQVKMIEIKLSQGAKPGKGGILPGAKVNKEISQIRGVPIGKTVYSPAKHSTFSTPLEMMKWIESLRELSGGKPIGFKLCLGKRREFYSICRAMVETGITPDFITIDGGEGGTGSAPVEFSNSVGTPLTEGLVEVSNALIGFGLRKKIKIIASAKISTGFHAAKYLSIGADLINIARGFMISLGCIQALKCHSDECPTGVATQKKSLTNGLNVKNKTWRVNNFHQELIHSLEEILNATGVGSPFELRRWHILKRVSVNRIMNYSELYPYPDEGVFLSDNIPEEYQRVLSYSHADQF